MILYSLFVIIMFLINCEQAGFLDQYVI